MLDALLLPTAYRVVSGRGCHAGADSLRFGDIDSSDPESDQYRGKIGLRAPGGRVKMDFTLRVVSPRKMVRSFSARVTVNHGGISGRCTISRGLVLNRRGN